MLSDGDKNVDNKSVNNVNNDDSSNVNDNISNTINHMDTSNLTAVKTEIKLEMEALNINKDIPSSSTDNIPLDQLITPGSHNDDFDADGNDDDKDTDLSAASDESMVVDDPELFGPFTRSQLTAVIQSDTDQMFYNSFQDQISLLESAIGIVSIISSLNKLINSTNLP